MGAKTQSGLKEYGAVYLTAIGGAAQIYAQCLPEVDGVDFLDEFGIPEAMWHYQARDFITVCTMDAHGNSLHDDIERISAENLGRIG